MTTLDMKNEYILYAHKDFNFPLPNGRWSKRVGAKTRYGSLWLQLELPRWLKEDRIDVFWGTQHLLPLMMPKVIKAVLNVHDLVHYVFPKTMKMLNFIINKLIIPPSIRRADAIAAISGWTLNDVRTYLKPVNKIMRVTHLGVGKQFYPRDAIAARQKIKHLYNSDDPYLLTVGTFEPRKNVVGIFRAFSLIAHQIPHHLVLVGQKGWKNDNVLEEIQRSNLIHRIHMPGYVEDELLPEMYSAADAFIFPSLYEGFGLPPLEAMACALPVVASNVSCLPEITGDAALLVNPQDPRDIANGILRIIREPALRQRLIEKGLKQAANFTWEKTAKQMLDIFNTFDSHTSYFEVNK
ncbi:MAG: glycosyltransferase family 4 protein [Elusimicrobia bacterium]|nr:glycosyltransferase family 4 protein [Candidatus Obscuribacterium magneticum]